MRSVLVAVLLIFALRSLGLAVATLLTLVLGLVWTAGFAAFAVGHLNLLSVAFAVLFFEKMTLEQRTALAFRLHAGK